MCKLQTPTDQADVILGRRDELSSYAQRLLCAYGAREEMQPLTWSGIARRIGLKSESEPTRPAGRRCFTPLQQQWLKPVGATGGTARAEHRGKVRPPQSRGVTPLQRCSTQKERGARHLFPMRGHISSSAGHWRDAGASQHADEVSSSMLPDSICSRIQKAPK